MNAQGNTSTPRECFVFSSLVFFSLGRFDPNFVPLQAAGLTANQLFFYLGCIFFTFLSLRYLRRWPLGNAFGIALLLLSIWATVSVLWSPAGISGLAKALSYLFVFFTALYFSLRLSPNEILLYALKGALLAVTVSAVLSILLPSSAGTTMFHDGAWRGLFLQKNVLGRAALILAGLAFILLRSSELRDHRRLAWFSFIIAVIVLFKSKSVTAMAILGLLIIVVPTCISLRKKSPSLRALVGFLALLLIPLLALAAEPALLKFAEVTGKSPTLTGRIPLWGFAIDRLAATPLIGFGLEGFFGSQIDAEFFSQEGWVAEHAHNGMIDLALEVGLIGFALFVISFLWFILAIPRTQDTTQTLSLLMILTALLLLLLNLTESNLFRSSNTLWFLYLVLGMSSVQFKRKSKTLPSNIASQIVDKTQ